MTFVRSAFNKLRRIYFSTWLLAALLTTGFVLVNVPGQRKFEVQRYWCNFGGIQFEEVYRHGWPWTYLSRDTIVRAEHAFESDVAISVWDVSSKVKTFHGTLLAADIGCALLIIAACLLINQRRYPHRPRWWQFLLRSFF